MAFTAEPPVASIGSTSNTRRPVTSRTDSVLATAAKDLLLEATAKKDRVKKWFANYILDGPAVAVLAFIILSPLPVIFRRSI